MFEKLSFKVRSFFKQEGINIDPDYEFEIVSYRRFYNDFVFAYNTRLATKALQVTGIKPHIETASIEAQEALVTALLMNVRQNKRK